MQEGTLQRMQPPALAGGVVSIVSFALYQYWRAGEAYFEASANVLLMTGVIITGLLALTCWLVAHRHLAEGRGLSLWYCALALLGPLGLIIMLYATTDHYPGRKPKYRRSAA